jgi:Mg/Co/Ni transporter MgtE
MKRDWAVGIGSGLIVALILMIAAWLIRSTPDLGSLWRRYWPVAVGVAVGALRLGTMTQTAAHLPGNGPA